MPIWLPSLPTSWASAEKFTALRTQLEAYQRGPLGGIELTGYRYGFVVTEQQLPRTGMPEEPVIDGVRLRYVNIAINPRLPGEEGSCRGR
jgi:hypothetical protein